MGIATGKVFCGPVGDQSRCEMSWIGDSVNHSARLMGMAMKTNAIYADKASVDAAASEVMFEVRREPARERIQGVRAEENRAIYWTERTVSNAENLK